MICSIEHNKCFVLFLGGAVVGASFLPLASKEGGCNYSFHTFIIQFSYIYHKDMTLPLWILMRHGCKLDAN